MEFTGRKSLKDYPEKEKTAYLAAVASMATPDDQASEEEIGFLDDLCEEAELTAEDREKVLNEAKNPTNDGFQEYLEWLRGSDLKFSFIVDVISFAKADGDYTETEKQRIQRMAEKLGLSIAQYDALYEYVDKAEKSQDGDTSEEGFLERTGLMKKFNNLNIPVKGLLTGLVGSMLMRGVMGRKHRRRGLLTSMLSGHRRSGGITSLVRMLSGRRGYKRSGGLISKLL